MNEAQRRPVQGGFGGDRRSRDASSSGDAEGQRSRKKRPGQKSPGRERGRGPHGDDSVSGGQQEGQGRQRKKRKRNRRRRRPKDQRGGEKVVIDMRRGGDKAPAAKAERKGKREEGRPTSPDAPVERPAARRPEEAVVADLQALKEGGELNDQSLEALENIRLEALVAKQAEAEGWYQEAADANRTDDQGIFRGDISEKMGRAIATTREHDPSIEGKMARVQKEHEVGDVDQTDASIEGTEAWWAEMDQGWNEGGDALVAQLDAERAAGETPPEVQATVEASVEEAQASDPADVAEDREKQEPDMYVSPEDIAFLRELTSTIKKELRASDRGQVKMEEIEPVGDFDVMTKPDRKKKIDAVVQNRISSPDEASPDSGPDAAALDGSALSPDDGEMDDGYEDVADEDILEAVEEEDAVANETAGAWSKLMGMFRREEASPGNAEEVADDPETTPDGDSGSEEVSEAPDFVHARPVDEVLFSVDDLAEMMEGSAAEVPTAEDEKERGTQVYAEWMEKEVQGAMQRIADGEFADNDMVRLRALFERDDVHETFDAKAVERDPESAIRTALVDQFKRFIAKETFGKFLSKHGTQSAMDGSGRRIPTAELAVQRYQSFAAELAGQRGNLDRKDSDDKPLSLGERARYYRNQRMERGAAAADKTAKVLGGVAGKGIDRVGAAASWANRGFNRFVRGSSDVMGRGMARLAELHASRLEKKAAKRTKAKELADQRAQERAVAARAQEAIAAAAEGARREQAIDVRRSLVSPEDVKKREGVRADILKNIASIGSELDELGV